MELIDLSGLNDRSLDSRHLIDWRPAAPIAPNEELRKQLSKPRRNKSGVAQSEHSRKRQSFMVGMDRYSGSRDEQRLRNIYIEEWYIRIGDNESIE